MRFTQEQIEAMQDPYADRKNWKLSATYSAMLTMENDGKIVEFIDRGRRVDGTATSAVIQAAFHQFKVPVDEWAIGKPNFEIMSRLFNEDRELVEVPDTIQLALRTAKFNGDRLQLTMQLERADYDKVNKIIAALGGNWKRGLQAHVFGEPNAEELVANYLATGKLDQPEDFGFFPTPVALARVLVKEAGLSENSKLLEPQAGVGGLADMAAEFVPKANIQCFEIQAKNCKTLRDKGYAVQEADFLSIAPQPIFSHVICNPPFKNQQDIDHVLHALKFLKPGGKLSAIMSNGVAFRGNRKTQQFRELVEQYGGKFCENEPGAFKKSGTMVRTVRVHMTVPAAAAIEKPSSSISVAQTPIVESMNNEPCVAMAPMPGVPVRETYIQAAFGF